MNFSSVKYVTYSTCSIFPEENEQVVRDTLAKVNKNGVTWRTVNLSQIDVGVHSSYLKGFHFSEELGSLRVCGHCGPKNYLNGFFLSIFERVEKE